MQEAIKKWQSDPLFEPHFRQVGFLNAVSGTAPESAKQILGKYLRSVSDIPVFQGKVVRCPDTDTIKRHIPELSGPMHGWNGYLNEFAGYVHAANALKGLYEDCVRRGISFRLGSWEGEVSELLFAPGTSRCIGARTHGKKEYYATKVIVALGANAARLVPSVGGGMAARCWGIAHIQLSPSEAASLRGIPVINVRDIGFFFEPDLETNKLKICHMGGGFTNYTASAQGDLSLPPSKLADSGFILQEDERAIRRLLREALPDFAERPLIDAHLCWFSDTEDSHYIIDYVPGNDRSLVVLSGDSGHAFKMLPIMGDFVLSLLADGHQKVTQWQWRDKKDAKPAEGVQWRTGSSKELTGTPRAKL